MPRGRPKGSKNKSPAEKAKAVGSTTAAKPGVAKRRGRPPASVGKKADSDSRTRSSASSSKASSPAPKRRGRPPSGGGGKKAAAAKPAKARKSPPAKRGGGGAAAAKKTAGRRGRPRKAKEEDSDREEEAKSEAEEEEEEEEESAEEEEKVEEEIIEESSSEDDDDDDDDDGQRVYYAVRRGRSIRYCVFFRWAECRAQLEDYDDAEFDVFEELSDASRYILEGEENRRRAKKGLPPLENDGAGRGSGGDSGTGGDGNKRKATCSDKDERGGNKRAKLDSSAGTSGGAGHGGDQEQHEDDDNNPAAADDATAQYGLSPAGPTENPYLCESRTIVFEGKDLRIGITSVLLTPQLYFAPNFDEHPANMFHRRQCCQRSRQYVEEGEYDEGRRDELATEVMKEVSGGYKMGSPGNFVKVDKNTGKVVVATDDEALHFTKSILQNCPRNMLPTWDERLSHLAEYKKTYGGSIDVPSARTGLGRWLAKQRETSLKFHQGGKISGAKWQREREKKLRRMGVELDPAGVLRGCASCAISTRGDESPDADGGGKGERPGDAKIQRDIDKWESWYDQLVDYKKRWDDVDVPYSSRGLGKWVSKQMDHFKDVKDGLKEETEIWKGQSARLVELGLDLDRKWRKSRESSDGKDRDDVGGKGSHGEAVQRGGGAGIQGAIDAEIPAAGEGSNSSSTVAISTANQYVAPTAATAVTAATVAAVPEEEVDEYIDAEMADAIREAIGKEEGDVPVQGVATAGAEVMTLQQVETSAATGAMARPSAAVEATAMLDMDPTLQATRLPSQLGDDNGVTAAASRDATMADVSLQAV